MLLSFEIKKIYTDNPYVDEMVYYTKLMGLDTVLKLQNLADSCETVESLKRADLYIACMEGTAIFEIFPNVSASALQAAGIIAPETIKRCLLDKNNVPMDKRDAVTKALVTEYIENYEELNMYYRALHGLPPVGREDYVEDWLPPDNVVIDLSKPVHMMDLSEISILEKYGIIDDLIEEDPANRQYMRHMGKKVIDYYTARKANRFDVLYLPEIDSDAIYKMYKDKLDSNKFYVLRTIYSEAYRYGSDYYDNFIAVLIVIITIIDVISRVQEFIARKEIFDIRSVQYIFKSNGIPFYEEIPLKYQISMVKNLHTLLRYKSTKKCMVNVCKLFGFDNIKIFKYYLLRDRKIDITTGEYYYEMDFDGNEVLDKMYELKFLKVPLEEDLDDHIRVSSNYMDYDEVTELDPTWDGGMEHEDVMKQIIQEEFNFVRTKYISIDTIYDIAKMTMQQAYFFNFLYDNLDLEGLLNINVPFIDATRTFNVADLFTFLTVLTYHYNGTKDTIMDTQSKVLYVNGFNFKADLAALAAEISTRSEATTVITSSAVENAKDILSRFIIPKSSIPSMKEMMDIFTNNLEIHQELIDGMTNADNIHIYNIYKKLYDSLMTVELTLDYYKNPETGDFYRDSEGDATFSEYLRNTDMDLYALILEVEAFEDVTSKNQYIANVIDSITWALEEFIAAEEFEGIYAGLPSVSAEVVKTYIATIINFYKSYKVDFLGMNTIYTFDDKNTGFITVIDGMWFNRFFQKEEYITLYQRVARSMVNMTHEERVALIDKVIVDINIWSSHHPEIEITMNDFVELFYYFIKSDHVILNEDIASFITNRTIRENLIPITDSPNISVSLSSRDNLNIRDDCWFIWDGQYITNMQTVASNNENAVLLADAFGQAIIGPQIITDVDDGTSGNLVSETGVLNKLSTYDTLTEDQIATSENVAKSAEEASDEKAVTEKVAYDAFTIEVL